MSQCSLQDLVQEFLKIKETEYLPSKAKITRLWHYSKLLQDIPQFTRSEIATALNIHNIPYTASADMITKLKKFAKDFPEINLIPEEYFSYSERRIEIALKKSSDEKKSSLKSPSKKPKLETPEINTNSLDQDFRSSFSGYMPDKQNDHYIKQLEILLNSYDTKIQTDTESSFPIINNEENSYAKLSNQTQVANDDNVESLITKIKEIREKFHPAEKMRITRLWHYSKLLQNTKLSRFDIVTAFNGYNIPYTASADMITKLKKFAKDFPEINLIPEVYFSYSERQIEIALKKSSDEKKSSLKPASKKPKLETPEILSIPKNVAEEQDTDILEVNLYSILNEMTEDLETYQRFYTIISDTDYATVIKNKIKKNNAIHISSEALKVIKIEILEFLNQAEDKFYITLPNGNLELSVDLKEFDKILEKLQLLIEDNILNFLSFIFSIKISFIIYNKNISFFNIYTLEDMQKDFQKIYFGYKNGEKKFQFEDISNTHSFSTIKNIAAGRISDYYTLSERLKTTRTEICSNEKGEKKYKWSTHDVLGGKNYASTLISMLTTILKDKRHYSKSSFINSVAMRHLLRRYYLVSRFSFYSVIQFLEMYTKHFNTSQNTLRIFDPSGGWGDRLLGFLVFSAKCDMSITTVEPNKVLCEKYNEMFNDCKTIVPALENKVKFRSINEQMEKITAKTHQLEHQDVIFSCPPYLHIEIPKADTNPHHCSIVYKTATAWEEGFWKPYLYNSFNLLRVGGVMGLVVNTALYKMLENLIIKNTLIGSINNDFKIISNSIAYSVSQRKTGLKTTLTPSAQQFAVIIQRLPYNQIPQPPRTRNLKIWISNKEDTNKNNFLFFSANPHRNNKLDDKNSTDNNEAFLAK